MEIPETSIWPREFLDTKLAWWDLLALFEDSFVLVLLFESSFSLFNLSQQRAESPITLPACL